MEDKKDCIGLSCEFCDRDEAGRAMCCVMNEKDRPKHCYLYEDKTSTKVNCDDCSEERQKVCKIYPTFYRCDR